jgi:hypothetical protein
MNCAAGKGRSEKERRGRVVAAQVRWPQAAGTCLWRGTASGLKVLTLPVRIGSSNWGKDAGGNRYPRRDIRFEWQVIQPWFCRGLPV